MLSLLMLSTVSGYDFAERGVFLSMMPRVGWSFVFMEGLLVSLFALDVEIAAAEGAAIDMSSDVCVVAFQKILGSHFIQLCRIGG